MIVLSHGIPFTLVNISYHIIMFRSWFVIYFAHSIYIYILKSIVQFTASDTLAIMSINLELKSFN